MMRTSDHTRLRIAGALATAAALLATAPAQAAGTTSAACTERFTSTISPGFSLVPSSGAQTSNGQTGTITCVGKLAGRRITGSGTIGFNSTYSASTCSSETGSGTVRLTLPTTAGPEHLVGALTIHRTALAVRVEAHAPGIKGTFIGVAIPMQGNCFLTPMRQALIVLTGTVSST